MGKQTDYVAVRQSFGLTCKLSDALMQACARVNPPIEVIHWLVTPKGRATMDSLVQHAVIDWQTNQPQQAQATELRCGASPYRVVPAYEGVLPANHYRMHVTYAPMPSRKELRKEFGQENVAAIFDGRPFEDIYLRDAMTRLPGEKIFLLHDIDGHDWKSEDRIAWGLTQRTAVAPNGYRPAAHDEAYEFQKTHPELQNVVALGSSAKISGRQHVAVIWNYDERRILAGHWFHVVWEARFRALFVVA